MRFERFDDALLKIIYLDAGLLVAAQTLGLDGVVSILFTLTFPLTGLLWLYTVRRTLTANDLRILLIAAASLAAIFLSGLLTGRGVALSGLKKWVMLMMTLLFFQTAHRLHPLDSTVRFLERMADALLLFLLAVYLLDRPRMYQLGGIPTEYLTFDFQNPNLAGLFLTTLYLLRLGRIKGKFWPIHGIFALILGYFVLKTQSRNCILVLTAGSAYWLLRRNCPIKLCKPTASVIAWFPAIFAAGYLLLVNWEPVRSLFRFLTGEGKELGSRVEMWTDGLEILSSAPLTGAYQAVSGLQLHNSHLDMAACYGIPVLILVCAFLTRYLRGPVSAGFVCCLLLGIGESALFSGGLGISLFAGAFLLTGEDDDEVS